MVERCSVNDLGAQLQEMKGKEDIFYFSLNAYGLGAWKVHTKYIFWKTMKFGKVANHCLKIQNERGKKKWCEQAATEIRRVWICTWGEWWKLYESCRQPVSFCLLVCLLSLFISLFLAALGLCCCMQTFSSFGEQGLLFLAVRRLPIVMASLECGSFGASVISARRLCFCSAYGIFLNQESNPCPLHWQAESSSLEDQGSPSSTPLDLLYDLPRMSACVSLENSSFTAHLLFEASPWSTGWPGARSIWHWFVHESRNSLNTCYVLNTVPGVGAPRDEQEKWGP